jgi:hypothetical protein
MNYANLMFKIKYIITFLPTISYIIIQTNSNIYYLIFFVIQQSSIISVIRFQ